MLDPAAYLLFLATSAALIVVPGPAQALVFASTVSGGRRAGVITAVGLNVGTLVHSAAAGLGLSAVLATSATAFSAVKYAGAAYLFYLGLRALRSGGRPVAAGGPSTASINSVLVQAVTTGILNPKVALFLLAFLPQFVDASRGPLLLQFLVLGASMAALDVLYEVVLVFLVAGARHRLVGNGRFQALQRRFSGGLLIALGVRLALQQR